MPSELGDMHARVECTGGPLTALPAPPLSGNSRLGAGSLLLAPSWIRTRVRARKWGALWRRAGWLAATPTPVSGVIHARWWGGLP